MKNIFLIPTEKPSRLAFYRESTSYNEPILKLVNTTSSDYKYQNIYITSDEEIEEGDWFTDDNNSLKSSYKLSHVQFANPKKIILTTDQDLIKDGVQAIDDDFLEWFVKNPTCEFVETEHIGYVNAYRIIILQEKVGKQETLEEASYNYAKDKINRTSHLIGFREGAKWQKEQDKKIFSEEEVLELLQKYRLALSEGKTPNLGDTTKYWFKQFKNK